MIDALRSWLAEVAPGRPPLGGAIVASMFRASPKATLVLLDDRGKPWALAKVARDAAAEPALAAEYEALERLAAAPSAWVRAQGPSPLGLGHVDGLLVLAETYVDGEPMTARYYTPGHTRSRRRVAEDFSRARRWLARFQRETAAGTRPLDDSAIDELVRDPIERYRDEIGWSEAESDLFDETIATAAALRGLSLPICGAHGDYWMANLLVDRAGVAGAVDWERSTLEGLPFDDVYKFPTSYAAYLDRAVPRSGYVPGHPGWAEARDRWQPYGDWVNLAGFGYAYFGRGWFPSLVQSWITDRSAALGVDPALHAIFFPVFLARQATSLADPIFRNGYRSAVLGFAAQRGMSWLWPAGSSSHPRRSHSQTSPRSLPGSRAGRST